MATEPVFQTIILKRDHLQVIFIWGGYVPGVQIIDTDPEVYQPIGPTATPPLSVYQSNTISQRKLKCINSQA